MLRWKRIGLLLLAVLAVGVGALYALRDQIADQVIRVVLQQAERAAPAGGVRLSNLEFERAQFAGVGVITCDDLRGVVLIDDSRVRLGVNAFRFRIGRIHVAIEEYSPGRARLGITDGLILGLTEAGQETGVQLSQIDVEWTVPFDWTSPEKSIAGLLQEAQRLPREGRLAGPARIEAVARFPVGGRDWEVAARTATDGSEAVFMLDRDALRVLAREHRHPLTEAEVDLVARHPFRAPRMLAIAEHAIVSAIGLRREVNDFPYDAYRHVYWSWLLTNEFGPDFSEMVTDAHEIGATYESGTAKRKMDLHNNAVGRAYALAGVPAAEILDRVMNDPNVMRRPDLQTEVQSLRR